MRAVVITRHGGCDVLAGRGAPRSAGRAGRGADRRPGRGDQLRRPDGALGRLSRRARPAVRGRLRGRRRGRGVGEGVEEHAVGDRVLAGTRFGGYAELVTVPADQVAPAARRAQLRAGRGLPGQLRDRVRGAGDHGRAEARRAGADPRRRRRGRDRRDPGREGDRRRDLRHGFARQARRDPRPGRRPPDRLPQPGLRRGGDADHRRRRPRPDHRRDRARRASARTTGSCGPAGGW